LVLIRLRFIIPPVAFQTGTKVRNLQTQLKCGCSKNVNPSAVDDDSHDKREDEAHHSNDCKADYRASQEVERVDRSYRYHRRQDHAYCVPHSDEDFPIILPNSIPFSSGLRDPSGVRYDDDTMGRSCRSGIARIDRALAAGTVRPGLLKKAPPMIRLLVPLGRNRPLQAGRASLEEIQGRI